MPPSASNDVSSDLSSDNDEEMNDIEEEMKKVNQVATFLKNYTPKKKRAQRSNNKVNKNINDVKLDEDDLITKVIKCLEDVCNISNKVISAVKDLQKKAGSNKKELAQVKESVNVQLEIPRVNIVPDSSVVPATGNIPKMMDRLESLEQESLANVVSCNGEEVTAVIDDGGDETDSNVLTLKTRFRNKLKDVCNLSVPETDIISVTVRGNTVRHLKVEFASKSSKLDVIRAVRNLKPNNFFISDYLTRTRSNLYYRIRQLKKTNAALTSVFSRNGIIMCKFDGSAKMDSVSCERDFVALETKLCGPRSDVAI